MMSRPHSFREAKPMKPGPRRARPVGARIAILCAAALVCLAGARPGATRTLGIDDVLGIARLDQVAASPDGAWLAAIVQRPAQAGETFGRTYYELDPSRSDLVLISRRDGSRRNLTDGRRDGAGYWCPIWSPDGSRLAMLSTRPEGREPRGGDNVRLYVWERGGRSVARLDDAGLMVQTMGGSPFYRVDLRGGSAGPSTQRCSNEENAPFTWLDNDRLVAIALPEGRRSGLIDAAGRPAQQARATSAALRAGNEPTVTAIDSGGARQAIEAPEQAELRVIDVARRRSRPIAELPVYPLRGELTVSLSPDGGRAAVMATLGVIPPDRDRIAPFANELWSVERRLGFVDLSRSGVTWVEQDPAARHLLDLYDWSPDGRAVAVRARASLEDVLTPLFLAALDERRLRRIGAAGMSVGDQAVGSQLRQGFPIAWLDDDRILARLAPAGAAAGTSPRADWWLLAPGAEPRNLTAGLPRPPALLRRMADGRLVATADGRIHRVDPASGRLESGTAVAGLDGRIVWPADRRASSTLVVARPTEAGQQLREVRLDGQPPGEDIVTLPAGAEILSFDSRSGAAFARVPTARGLQLREASLRGAGGRDLLALNAHFAAIDWGRTGTFDYRTADGRALRAATILPPDYQPGRRYPTLVWVYPGYGVSDPNDYFLDPYLPGIYNLQLYAARGYVVLIPSMPSRRSASPEPYRSLLDGVAPAIDHLVEAGIADPSRLAVMGQSMGGYGVYGLLSQTDRFRAGIAISGITDLAAFYSQFDESVRGFGPIEHEASFNWSLLERAPFGLRVPPYQDHGLYWRNSPIAYVDRIEAPLLIVHAEHDNRASLAQAEALFYGLYRQGKTARFLRYWGENHGLARSPANIRSLFAEINRWLDTHLAESPPAR